MSVKLFFAATENIPGGHYSVFNTKEEALAQACADVAANRTPRPVRIEDEDGSNLADTPAIDKAAAAEAKAAKA